MGIHGLEEPLKNLYYAHHVNLNIGMRIGIMARPTKQGIDYFPVDVQFDDQLELLITDKGGIALSVIITIWQLIYQNNGYYIENGHDLLLLIKRRIMVDPQVTEDIITAALDRGIFDKNLHEKYNILTSRGIQKRYVTAARLKKSINIVKNYLLIDVSNVGNAIYIGINVVGNATNVKEDVDVKEEVDIYIPIFKKWNEQKIIIHKKITPRIKSSINSALKEFSRGEILQAFENYKTVLSGAEYYFTYKWTLEDFLKRGLRKFVNEADPFNNFKSKKRGSNGTSNEQPGIAASFAETEYNNIVGSWEESD